MKTEKATKELCRRLTREIGNGYLINDEGREVRVYHRSGKRRGMCCATYLGSPEETAHALAATIAAHKAARKPMTKESVRESLECFHMALSHYVYGDPSVPGAEALKRDAESGLNGGRGYFADYDIPRRMKVILLDRCRKAIASVRYGVGTDSEGGYYNSCTVSDTVRIA